MENKGEIFISLSYKKEDYLNLKLKKNSDEWKWKKAVDILKDRIEGRYFNQIETLSTDIHANGFTIMALNCLLFDTLLQFREGIDKTPSGKNKEKYIEFLETYFSVAFDEEGKAKSFYENVRCGILHSAQTKAGARLSTDDGFVVRFKEKTLEVSVSSISSLLKEYFNDYTTNLLNPAETELRENFIAKMKFVCRR